MRKKGYSFVSLLLLLLIILIIFNFKAILNTIQPDLSFGKIKVSEMFHLKKDNFDNEKSIFVVENGLIQIKEKKIFFIDKNYVTEWYKEIKGNNIDIYNNDKYIYIIDLEMGDIFKIDYKGNIIAKIYSQGCIFKVLKYDNDELVIVNDEHHLIKYDNELNVIKNVDINLEHVFDVKFKDDKYYILNVENKNNYFFTRLVMLDENFEFVSNLNINNSILYNVFIESDMKILNGNKKIVKVDEKDEVVWETSYEYLINNIVVDNTNIYINLIEENNDENKTDYNFFKILNEDGIVISEIQSPIENIKNMLVFDDKFYLISDKKICVLNKELEIIFLKEVEESIVNIELLYDNQMLINTENNVIIYQVRF
jgi:hypothetical protein